MGIITTQTIRILWCIIDGQTEFRYIGIQPQLLSLNMNEMKWLVIAFSVEVSEVIEPKAKVPQNGMLEKHESRCMHTQRRMKFATYFTRAVLHDFWF